MKIILHVGAHRTATTTLQRMMGQNGTALTEASVSYWGPKRTRGRLFQGLIGQVEAVTPWQEKRAKARIEAKLDSEAELGFDTVFVSEENMIGTMREASDDIAFFLDPGTRLSRFIQGMAGHDLTVAMAVRSYDDWWASVLGYRVTRGGPMPGPNLCQKIVAQPRRWRHVIRDLAKAVPQARLRIWRHETMAQDLDEVVNQLLGLKLDLPGAEAWLNTTDNLSVLRDYVVDLGHGPDVIREEAGRFMPFDPDQRAELRAHYAEDLAWLAAGAGGLADVLEAPKRKTAGLTG